NHSNLPAFGLLANRMNDWFEDAQAFLDELAKSRYVTPGDPAKSYILNNRTTYAGPMYKVFSPAELELWPEWIRCLPREHPPTAPAPLAPATAMQRLIEALSSIAANTPAHLSRELVGTLGGQRVRQSVAAWFKAGAPALMAALSDPENGWIVPYSPATSK